MNFIVRHIIKGLLFSGLLFFAGCSSDDVSSNTPTPTPPAPGEDLIRFELFTRADSYGVPVSRAGADENNLDKTPWILVFSGSTNTATCLQVVQAEIIGTKSYVYLKPQSGACQLLVFGNPPANFYKASENSSTAHAFSQTPLETAALGKTLTAVCQELLFAPLPGPQVGVPFVTPQQKLAMSDLVPVAKIDVSVTLPTINLKRAVGKVMVKSTAPDFTLNGVTTVMNTPKQAQMHLLGTSLAYNTGVAKVIEYHANSTYTADLAPAAANTTEANPIYMYESECAENKNNTFIIIRARYDGEELFYKMAFVDTGWNQLNIQRNYEYLFTITAVKGRGYSTVADAVASRASNTNLQYSVLVQDLSSYEIMSNNDYYVGVTNSHLDLYAPNNATKEYIAFTLVTDCKTNFPDKNYVKSLTAGLTIKTTANSSATTLQPGVTNGGKIPVSTTNPCNIVITVANTFTSGQIEIHLGSLKKIVTVRRHVAVSAPVAPGHTDIDSFIDGTVSYVSAYIDNYPTSTGAYPTYNGIPNASYWLQLSPDGTTVRNDPHHIYVDNGTIYLRVQKNASGSEGDVYVATKGTVDTPVRRIKVHITHI